MPLSIGANNNYYYSYNSAFASPAENNNNDGVKKKGDQQDPATSGNDDKSTDQGNNNNNPSNVADDTTTAITDNTGGDAQNQDNKDKDKTTTKCSEGQHYDDKLKKCVNDKPEEEPKQPVEPENKTTTAGGGGGGTTEENNENKTAITPTHKKEPTLQDKLNLSQKEKDKLKPGLRQVPITQCGKDLQYCEFTDDGIGYCDNQRFDCIGDDDCYDTEGKLRSADCNRGKPIPITCPTGTKRNDITGQCDPTNPTPPSQTPSLKDKLGLSKAEKDKLKIEKHLRAVPIAQCGKQLETCEFTDDGIGYCDNQKFDCIGDDDCYNTEQKLRSAECNSGHAIPFKCEQGTRRNDITGQCEKIPAQTPPISSKTNIKIVINQRIIQGSEPIGSTVSSTQKLFKEFNNRTNAVTGLVVTDTTMTKNQFVSSGQIEIAGHLQNMRTTITTAASNTNINMNTAKMIIVVATLYDSTNHVIGVQYGASDPNILRPDESGVFYLIVNNVENIDHVTYLIQWLDLGGVIHPTMQETKIAAASTNFPG
jgi:hypothetical protein